jgi:hypothetical protein
LRLYEPALAVGAFTDLGMEIYREFIEEASKCYADALQHDKPDTGI